MWKRAFDMGRGLLDTTEQADKNVARFVRLNDWNGRFVRSRENDLVRNIPTEEVLRALAQRGVNLSLGEALAKVAPLNRAIADELRGSLDFA